MIARFTESVVEEAALDAFRELGYAVLFGPEIAPGESGAESKLMSGEVRVREGEKIAEEVL